MKHHTSLVGGDCDCFMCELPSLVLPSAEQLATRYEIIADLQMILARYALTREDQTFLLVNANNYRFRAQELREETEATQ